MDDHEPGALTVRPPLGPADALVVDGTVLRDRSGRPVVLHGTNLGGWLMHEGWISPMGVPSVGRAGWDAPASAIDGDAATGWEGHRADDLVIDMGEMHVIERVSLVASATAGGPSHVQVETSEDGRTWQPFGSIPVGLGRRSATESHRTVRYLRIRGDGWSDAGTLVVSDVRAHLADEWTLRRRLAERFGPTGSERLLAVHQATWIDDRDLDRIAAIGLDMVRVPIHWQVLAHDDGSMRRDSAFERIDWVVEAAGSRGLRVVLDLHGAPGGANPAHFGGRAGHSDLWSDPWAVRTAERIWQALAGRYRGVPAIAAYDLVNEPLTTDGGPEDESQARRKYEVIDHLYRVVRAVDPDHVVMIPAFPSLASAPAPRVHGWTNVVYESHHFGGDAHDDEAGQSRFVRTTLEQLAAARDAWGVPVFVGEFWLSDFMGLTAGFVAGLEALGISWATWTYKHKNPPDARFPNGITMGPSWALVHDGPDAEPDIDHDDEATIAERWARYRSDAFRSNEALAAALRSRRPLADQ